MQPRKPNKPPAATRQDVASDPSAAASPPDQAGGSTGQNIEGQVEALLDQAQAHVQAISQLSAEVSPDEAVAPPVNEASSEATVGAATEEPIDPVALQKQVDAILEEAGHFVDEPAGEADEDDAAASPLGAGAPVTATATVATPAASALQDPARAVGPAQTDDEVGRSGVDTTPVDLAAVDAVIADAALKALEEDVEPADEATPSVGAMPAPRTGAGVGPTVAASAAASSGVPAVSRKPVVKGGDASMRRGKKKRVAPDSDLDGDFARPSPEPEPSAEESAVPTEPAPMPEPGGNVASSSPRAPIVQRLGRFALTGLAALNAPWHTWPLLTRYAVLALTLGNVLLAAIAFTVVLSRLI